VEVFEFATSLEQDEKFTLSRVEGSPVCGAGLLSEIYRVIIIFMKTPDPNKERNERKLSLTDFLKYYNEKLPLEFPRAAVPLLQKFKKTYPGLFKDGDMWSLCLHRKKFMDWRPQRIKSLP